VRKKSAYIIGFSGLKEGLHNFDFELGDAFFAEKEFSEVNAADIQVDVELNKHSNMLELQMDLKGSVTVPCDRCLQPLSLPIDMEEEVIVKFGEEEDLESEVIVLKESAYEIDIEQLLFEFVQLALPLRKVHDEKDCDPKVLKRLSAEDEVHHDSRWDALKDINLE
jgi:uncharacterized protein